MVDSSRRRGQRREVMSNHVRCWIWGRNVVLETLRAGTWPILELLVADSLDERLMSETLRQAEQMRISVTVATDANLTKSCRTAEHQGFAARMAPFPFRTLDELNRLLPANGTVAVLDRLQDPFNFGAIVRSASTLGIDGILIGDREQSDVNSQVARSSVGAINHLPIAQTDNLSRAVDQFREQGFQVVAASEKAESALYEADFRRPTVVLIGNEGRGIGPDLLSRCDECVSIPMSGQVGSLNAAVAAGILFYEMRRQRSLPKAR
ncbi:MAG: 23S rRNA (guanosine(2251)-2'-O)-methyltransferase RlmB [Planctomycetes bacterium]|nr:23S rRNA (guanosine(2251)-2'-O)-methyltransferase RlmB [Planctomycetota bacterium]